MFNSSPLEIVGDSNNKAVKAVKFIKTEEINGKLQAIQGSEFEIACDIVIRATGQSKQRNFLSLISDMNLDKNACMLVDSQTYQTSNPLYFGGGDAVNGGAEVVNAVQQGRDAAKGIHKFLSL
jgi:glutamate synthase (NADPH/NADH) small chain